MQNQVSYEKLFDFLRDERNNVQLQTLPDSFYEDIVAYLDMKEKAIDSLKQNGSITYENAEIQLKNARKIIGDIFDRREKKILNISMTKSRTNSQLLDTSALLPEEKVFFEEVTEVLDKYRKNVLLNLLEKKLPKIKSGKKSSPKAVVSEDAPVQKQDVNQNTDDEEMAVKIISYVDKFVGPDLEIFGPFEKDKVIRIPQSIAKNLITDGLAEKI